MLHHGLGAVLCYCLCVSPQRIAKRVAKIWGKKHGNPFGCEANQFFFFLVNSVEMAVRMWGGNWCSQSESSVSIRSVLQDYHTGFNKHKKSCPCLYICFSNRLFLSTPCSVRAVNIWVERMFPADSPNSISWQKELWQPLATTWLNPSSPFPLERFEIPSILKLANFYPCTPSFEIPS